jgi:hypothetical protein
VTQNVKYNAFLGKKEGDEETSTILNNRMESFGYLVACKLAMYGDGD